MSHSRMGKQEGFMQERKYFMDNLRWLCILLLVPFHAAMAYNSWGEQNYVWFAESKILSVFVTMIYPWYMALLFVLAGMSARYSLEKRTVKEYVRERVQKLLFPLLFGLLTVIPVMAYYADVFWNHYSGGFLSHYGIFFTRFTDLTGYDGGFTPGHLWFLLYLFLISAVSLGIICLQKRFLKGKREKFLAGMNIGIIYLLGLLPAVFKPVLDIGGKSLGTFLALFLLGYYILPQEEVLGQIKKYRLLSLFIFLAADVTDTYWFIYCEHVNGLLSTAAMQIALWTGVLSALGFGSRYFDVSGKVTGWLAKVSFDFYIWHFMWLVICQFYLCRLIENVWALFFASVLAAYALTFATVIIVQIIIRKK